MRKVIRARPEVESVVSQHGRPDDGTDAAGFFNAEFFAPLKPVSQWPGSHDKEKVTAELLAELQKKFPGVEFNFSQYLQDNVSEAVSGVKGENSIKLYGNDLQALTDTANKIKNVLATVDGITDLGVFTSLGQPTIQIDVDRAKAFYRPRHALRSALRQLASYTAADGALGIRPARLFRPLARCVVEVLALAALRWSALPLLLILALENYFAFHSDWRSLQKASFRTLVARLIFSLLVPWIVSWNQIKGSITKANQPNRQNA